jgi:hypothetical protein
MQPLPHRAERRAEMVLQYDLAPDDAEARS